MVEFNKVMKIMEKRKILKIITTSNGEQWFGNGMAAYKIGEADFSEKSIQPIIGDLSKWEIYSEADVDGTFADVSPEDIEAGVYYQFAIKSEKDEYIIFALNNGNRIFADSKYFAPIKIDKKHLFYMRSGLLAVKDGLELVALITPSFYGNDESNIIAGLTELGMSLSRLRCGEEEE